MGTLLQVYTEMKNLLAENEIASASFEADCLIEFVLGGKRLDIGGDFLVPSEEEKQLIALCNKRREGYPLQYILKSWQFFDLELTVGEGVLIPRQDTETVCERAFTYIQKLRVPNVLDLCSGSGAIGLSIKKYCPNAVVSALEKSKEAYEYLLKNIQATGLAVLPILSDVFIFDDTVEDETFDVIISNPPYIREELQGKLQKEIDFEPPMALFAPKDGLRFYAFIIEYYKRTLKDGGLLIFEYGFDQKESVRYLLLRFDYRIIEEITDAGGNPRGIIAQKP
ncbi:MAG: peptide chain release factor N(5)-glutamine methyltransferase [Oscillospiraceae bacterium]